MPGHDRARRPYRAEITSYYGYSSYHYRLVTENQFGATYGKDLTFTTEPAPKPIVTETEVEESYPDHGDGLGAGRAQPLGRFMALRVG